MRIILKTCVWRAGCMRMREGPCQHVLMRANLNILATAQRLLKCERKLQAIRRLTVAVRFEVLDEQSALLRRREGRIDSMRLTSQLRPFFILAVRFLVLQEADHLRDGLWRCHITRWRCRLLFWLASRKMTNWLGGCNASADLRYTRGADLSASRLPSGTH